ncbi:hypothetical protein KVP04_04825 [Halobacterium salinarum]|uniref:hypothetical protein n=1 Tax=Halobacterium salinarum TaxID=2242 RepID=UPI001F3A3FCB|nr:hypothetical protein [Halobacterium salinarum]MCF2164401.1 hypothetical protein [Halobacterium salinarum]MCF2167188.1 hypothetical protein [Halobacterium salinarum]MCF2238452.1 hypothetical protein [Halobacterium salinarum]
MTLDVNVESDGEVWLDETYKFREYKGDDTPYVVIDRGWMDDLGRYTLTIESSTMEDTVKRKIPNRGAGCYAVIIRVWPSGRIDVPMDTESSCDNLDQLTSSGRGYDS